MAVYPLAEKTVRPNLFNIIDGMCFPATALTAGVFAIPPDGYSYCFIQDDVRRDNCAFGMMGIGKKMLVKVFCVHSRFFQMVISLEMAR